MPLTELQIKALKPEAIRYAVSDGRGLALEVLPTGAASWRYRYQFKGKTEKVSLGKYPLISPRPQDRNATSLRKRFMKACLRQSKSS
jgi:Arm DNA-binding domain